MSLVSPFVMLQKWFLNYFSARIAAGLYLVCASTLEQERFAHWTPPSVPRHLEAPPCSAEAGFSLTKRGSNSSLFLCIRSGGSARVGAEVEGSFLLASCFRLAGKRTLEWRPGRSEEQLPRILQGGRWRRRRLNCLSAGRPRGARTQHPLAHLPPWLPSCCPEAFLCSFQRRPTVTSLLGVCSLRLHFGSLARSLSLSRSLSSTHLQIFNSSLGQQHQVCRIAKLELLNLWGFSHSR